MLLPKAFQCLVVRQPIARGFLWTSLLLATACSTSQKATTTTDTKLKDAVLFTAGDDTVTADEFMYVYRKNQSDSAARMSNAEREQAIRDYLKLYVNFKLKVEAAEDTGMANKESFKTELAQYQKQLAKPYLVENRVTDQLIEEAYERMKQEVKASHILIQVPEDASPADTLAAYQQIDSLRNLALNGASFAMLAEQYSNDPSAATNGGDLGYFTALQMVYPFENAAYRTEEGDISEPFRTRFGYHIVKVHDKRPSQGQIKVSHIMIRADEDATQDSAAHQKAQQIYEQLRQGADWNELTERFSDDVTTRSSGGALPYFGTGNMIESFEEAAFALKKPGDISPPVKTRFGWHIIKLDDRKGLEPLSEMRSSLEKRVDRSVRSEVLQEEMIVLLKEENGYQGNMDAIKSAVEHQYQSPDETPDSSTVLFTMQDTTLTVADFLRYTENDSTLTGPLDSATAYQQYHNFENSSILQYEENHLLEKYEDYRRILQEYRDGILLFDIMEQRVWSKAMEDSVRLQQFFEAHREDYRWKERAKATIVDAESEKVLNEVKQALEKEKLPLSESARLELEKKFTQTSPLTLQIHQNTYEEGASRTEAESVIDQVEWKPGEYTVENKGRFYYIVVDEILPPQLKSLAEIKGIVIADYQNYLDQQWIAQLRQKYPVDIQENVLQQVIKSLNAS